MSPYRSDASSGRLEPSDTRGLSHLYSVTELILEWNKFFAVGVMKPYLPQSAMAKWQPDMEKPD